VSYGALGSTHHSLHDLAALRAINNIDIVVPADNAKRVTRSKPCCSLPPDLHPLRKAPLHTCIFRCGI
jgi:transketolase